MLKWWVMYNSNTNLGVHRVNCNAPQTKSSAKVLQRNINQLVMCALWSISVGFDSWKMEITVRQSIMQNACHVHQISASAFSWLNFTMVAKLVFWCYLIYYAVNLKFFHTIHQQPDKNLLRKHPILLKLKETYRCSFSYLVQGPDAVERFQWNRSLWMMLINRSLLQTAMWQLLELLLQVVKHEISTDHNIYKGVVL